MATRINFRKIFGHSRGFTSKKKNGSFFSLPLKPVTEVHSSSFLVLVYATRYLQVPQSLGNRNSFLIAHVHKHEVIISINYRRNHSAVETSVVYVSLPFFMGHCRITCLPSGFPRQCGKLYSVSNLAILLVLSESAAKRMLNFYIFRLISCFTIKGQ